MPLILLIISSAFTSAAVIHIPEDFPTIQQGIDHAIDGDSVLVAAGTYEENINFMGKNIVLQGADWETTIIDGSSSGTVVIIDGGLDSTAVLSGFTIKNGYHEDRAGGIYCANSSPVLSWLIIRSNITGSHGNGGGVYFINSNPEMKNILLTANEAFSGGAIFLAGSTLDAGSLTITGNSATYWGALSGSGNALAVIKNSIIWGNSGAEVDLFLNNIYITYSDISGGWSGTGNIDMNPLFCAPAIANYTLAENSPCLESGTNGGDMGSLGHGCNKILVAETFYTIPGEDQVIISCVFQEDEDVSEIFLVFFTENINEIPLTVFPSGGGNFTHSRLSSGSEYFYKLKPITFTGDTLSTIPGVVSATTQVVSHNMALLGFWNLREGYNDIWGYEDGNGTEYALMGSYSGTSIIDISSSAQPQEVGYIPGLGSLWRDIKTYQNYMYVSTEASQGIQVVDIADPANPELLGEWEGVIGVHNIMADTSGYLYIIGANEGPDLDDLIILDLATDPENPQKIGGWTEEKFHDVCLNGDILYGCAIYADGMYALDVSDKTNPTMIHSWEGIPSAHACWVSEDGNILFTASETSGGHIMSWDVSQVEEGNVNLLDEWLPDSGEEWSAHNIFVKDGYLYISYYVFGLQVLDISDPQNMTLAGYYDTYLETTEYLYSGAWGTYPYLSDNKAVISDMSTGLYVARFESGLNVITGDLNLDGAVNILDIIMLVNYILDGQFNSAGDLNGDGSLDVIDVVQLVGIILD